MELPPHPPSFPSIPTLPHSAGTYLVRATPSSHVVRQEGIRREALSQDPVAKLAFLAVRKLHEASEGGRGVEGLGQCLDEGEELLFVQQQKFGDGHSVHPPESRCKWPGWRLTIPFPNP